MRSRVYSVPEYLAVRTFPSVEAVRNAYDWDVAMCAGRYSHWRNLRFSKGAYIVLVRALDLEQAMELQQQIWIVFSIAMSFFNLKQRSAVDHITTSSILCIPIDLYSFLILVSSFYDPFCRRHSLSSS